MSQGNWDKAIESYILAINDDPTDAIFYANRAHCYLNKGKFNEVEMDYTSALQLNKTYVKAYQRWAVARQHLGEWKEGKQDVRKWLNLNQKTCKLRGPCCIKSHKENSQGK